VDVANTVAAFHPELSKNPTPQEVMNVIRPTVDKWIREAIQEAQSSLVQATQHFVKSTDELLKSQEQAVQNWLVQYMHKELPRLLEQGSATLASSAQDQLKEITHSAHEVNHVPYEISQTHLLS
jgi:exonuclease VII large subunit